MLRFHCLIFDFLLILFLEISPTFFLLKKRALEGVCENIEPVCQLTYLGKGFHQRKGFSETAALNFVGHSVRNVIKWQLLYGGSACVYIKKACVLMRFLPCDKCKDGKK